MLSIEVLVNNQLLQECFQSVNLKALNSHYLLSVQHARQKTVSLRKTAVRGFCPIKSISNKDGYHQRFSIFKTSKISWRRAVVAQNKMMKNESWYSVKMSQNSKIGPRKEHCTYGMPASSTPILYMNDANEIPLNPMTDGILQQKIHAFL